MAKKSSDSSKVWSAMSLVAVLGAAAVTKKALNTSWKAATAKVVVTSNKPPWIAGYSNDVLGYIFSLRVPREVGYEGGGNTRYIRSTPYPDP